MEITVPSDQKSLTRQLGGSLVKSFSHIVSSLRIHQDNNQLIKDSVAKFQAILGQLSGGSDLSVQIWRGRFYIQGEKLLYQRETFHIINEMLEYFTRRGITGIFFGENFASASVEDFLSFARLLNESVKREDPVNWIDEQIDKNGYSWVELTGDHEESQQSSDARRKEKARYTYFQALSTVKEVGIKASKGITGVRKARRLAQTLVDLIREDNSLLLGMTTIGDYDDYTYSHSVNVALLATCLGRYVGLSEIYLEFLTVCGLFHDLGKVEVSKDILLKEGKLNDEEWVSMRKHPLVGVRHILRLQASHSLKTRIILGPFEHHLNMDLSGYPKTHFMKKVSLLGKILRIADVYEALTADRVYRSRPFTPEEALRRMWSEAGKSFDPLLLKSFINMMGIYPVGSIVELDNGEIGIVMEYPDETDRIQPLVMLLVNDGKGGFTRGGLMDLSAQEPGEKRTIVRGIHPLQLGIQPSQFLLQP
jgi:HD-GYP domain-containing protein (c-di-GMP phosphodiesterase class II)